MQYLLDHFHRLRNKISAFCHESLEFLIFSDTPSPFASLKRFTVFSSILHTCMKPPKSPLLLYHMYFINVSYVKSPFSHSVFVE